MEPRYNAVVGVLSGDRVIDEARYCEVTAESRSQYSSHSEGIVISACDTLITYTALFKDGARKHKRRKNIPWNKTNSGVLPSFDPASEYPIHSSNLTEYFLC